MDKNAIKKYAVWARRELISRVSQRAAYFEITEAGFGDPTADSVLGRVLSAEEKAQRQALIAQIRQKGYQQVMEEVAYTWFNRFIALRFMEVNGYLPSHVRVFTDETNQFKPQILAEAIHMELDGLDLQKVYAFKNANDDDGLFKYLVIVQCNALSSILPGMFQRISDYTELLFPDNLLREGSVLQQMIELIPEEDWKDAVQIIGWLYQYYNAEKKDEVFAALKKNVKITKENIPAATQLFTPDWIVRYMVENSLGRLWLEHLAAAGKGYHYSYGDNGECSAAAFVNADTVSALKGNWKYYLDEATQEPEVQAQLTEIRKGYATMTPEQIKCIDPCCGSGHILAYLFDVLMQIYESYGYTTREAVANIVQNNLYGLDIDDRAAQLAYFAVMMKARQYDRRFFSRGIQPHVYAIRESNGIDRYTLEYFCNGDAKLKAAMDSIIKEMHDAKEYGSILNITPVDFSALYARFDEVRDDIHMNCEVVLNNLLPGALGQKYDVVVTNPPYMGIRNMNDRLSDFIKEEYTAYKADFFSSFVIHGSEITKRNGFCGFFTPYVWMFIQSYEDMRNYLYNQATIETLIQFEYSAFEEATVPVCAFSFRNCYVQKKGCYLRLVDFRGGMEVQRQKTLEAIANHDCGFYYEQSTDNFSKIPGSPVAYWVNENVAKAFDSGKTLSSVARTRQGLASSDNNRFLKLWWEPSFTKIGFGIKNAEIAKVSKRKWFPCNKGGEFRKWYGNNIYVVNWENDGQEMLEYAAKLYGSPTRTIKNIAYYFQGGMTWGTITSGKLSMRHSPVGFIPEHAGGMIPLLHWGEKEKYLLGMMNSNTAMLFLSFLSPTLRFTEGPVGLVPILYDEKYSENIAHIVNDCESNSVLDWDSFETSWDFVEHPLIRHISTVAEAFAQWKNECETRFNQLKANEEDLNRIFIDIYGLQDELTPEVVDKDVTVHYLVDTKDDIPESMRGSNYVLTRRDVIVSLLSYAVGCMFGRYSLDVDGLVYAGGAWDSSKYTTFPADENNIIPICDDEYFEDDIVGRFVKFIETVYGSDALEENLKFIADALGGKGTPRDVIRSYFLDDFYADHCKTYQKRPIYWLFDSGKKNGFKALIYLHRYQPDTIARLRTDYVHEQQGRYRTAIADLESRIASASTAERVKLNKQLKKLQEQDAELRDYEEKIHHLADQMISIDLDDGVKVNYAKFQDVLAKIK